MTFMVTYPSSPLLRSGFYAAFALGWGLDGTAGRQGVRLLRKWKMSLATTT